MGVFTLARLVGMDWMPLREWGSNVAAKGASLEGVAIGVDIEYASGGEDLRFASDNNEGLFVGVAFREEVLVGTILFLPLGWQALMVVWWRWAFGRFPWCWIDLMLCLPGSAVEMQKMPQSWRALRLLPGWRALELSQMLQVILRETCWAMLWETCWAVSCEMRVFLKET